MVASTSVSQAIAQFEAKTSTPATSSENILLYGRNPPIKVVDPSPLAKLTSCRHLSFSTNSIDRLSLPPMPSLEVLSVGRNLLRKLDGLEAVAPQLKELWMSYNSIEKLTGIERCSSLRILYASNNKIKDWSEIERLVSLPLLEDLLLLGNPIASHEGYREHILQKLPHLKKLDGEVVQGRSELQEGQRSV